MKVLLIDVDSKIPNLAIMKISAFHKNKGDDVTLYRLGRSAFKKKRATYIEGREFNLCYVSTVFDTNKNGVVVVGCKTLYGGSGSDLSVKLPVEIEEQKPDYTIYPDCDISIGFITRGCIRSCKFCIVPQKEGNIRKVNDIENIIMHQRVSFLDNNILAYKDHKKELQTLIDLKIKCNFQQGLDIRLIDDENATLLSQIRYMGEYTFAFDDVSLVDIINKKLEILKKYISKDWKMRFFLYCASEHTTALDIGARIVWCKENKVLPYLMRDKSVLGNKFITELTSWCNQPRFFKYKSFSEYLKIRTIKEDRRALYADIWEYRDFYNNY